jgi:hypothetical protein
LVSVGLYNTQCIKFRPPELVDSLSLSKGVDSFRFAEKITNSMLLVVLTKRNNQKFTKNHKAGFIGINHV